MPVRRALPFACALLAGCTVSQSPKRAIVPAPGHSVTVFWTIDAACRDVLETTADLNSGEWLTFFWKSNDCTTAHSQLTGMHRG